MVSRMSLVAVLLLLSLPMLTGSCASHKRPVLFPNSHLEAVGEAQAQADIDACLEWAATQVEKNLQGEKAAEEGAKGAVGGAAGGAAAGAVTGGNVGRSAGAGAAAGAAFGVVRGLWDGAEPEPVYKRFVEECLRQKGYNPQGWQ